MMRPVLVLWAALFLQDGDLDALKTRFEAEKDQPAARRLETVAALGALQSEPAAACLVDVYDKDKDPGVRAEALRALRASGVPAGLKRVSAVAQDAAAPTTLRAAAIDALTDPPSPEGLAVARGVARERGELRVHAWAGLRRYPLKETEPVWRMGLDDGDPAVRALALQSLAPRKEVRLQDQARALLGNPDENPLLRYAAVTVLATAGGSYNARAFLGAASTPDPTLRRMLSDALGSLTEESAAKEIFQALRHVDPSVRAVAARSLGKLKHPQADDRLSEPLRDKQPEVRAAALEAVAERRDKNSESILHREAQGANEEAAAVAVALLPAYPSDATRALLLRLATNSKPGIALPALEALAELKAPEALSVLERTLKSKDWPVRAASIRALARLRSKEALDLLVDRMAHEEGRLMADLTDALRVLTGKPFGYAPGQWKEWWTLSREAFAFPDKPVSLAALAAGGGTTTYHGVPVLSTRIVFCLDISGSMSDASSGESRMELAKKELARVLGTLPKDAHANLIFFDDRVEPWRRALVPVASTLAQARQAVTTQQPRGGTNIFDALEAALVHKDADTIYLLSDGDPTNGRIIDPDDILREIRRVNRLRQVVIHTICFGTSDFMKRLAESNGGLYVEIK